MKKILLTIICVAVILEVAFFIESTSCYTKYEQYNPTYSVMGGCRIKWHSKLTPVEIININL